MGVEKARLDSHVFPAISEAYESPFLLPWGPNTKLFVRASSPRLLSMSSSPLPPAADDSFAGFSRAIRTHIHSMAAATTPTTVYSDVLSSQVLAVFTSTSLVDFVQFSLLPVSGDR